ncbi:hypothetical protein OWR29_46720 [Actinoplanes sp. Pm04-4]|uniref:Uncharacterized protein n=1 Tax=Paractinoplanes pyxinae TaxID=2997416 RepID=A0ABT4BG70_9ACTN|nr:hypothetical protein [Actinoplanes pyxinae]MCY1145544.1 hypothetical protein [Actinoplanes pyxinae]
MTGDQVFRSHGDFLCAGDQEALAFCEEIVDVMIGRYKISRSEAVACVNRQWPATDAYSRIVGSSIVYHEDADFWAADIYYGGDSRWWRPDADLRPLPPP